MNFRMLPILLFACLPAHAEANDRVRLCLDEFHEQRDLCLDGPRGRVFSECMKAAVERKNLCLQDEQLGEVEIAIRLAPAEIEALSLDTLGVAPDVALVQAPPGDLENGVPKAAVFDGRLVLAAPGDTGVDRSFEFLLSNATTTYRLLLNVPTTRSVEILRVSESDGEGGSAAPGPALSIVGLGEGNAIGGQDLLIGVDGAPAFDPVESRFLIDTARGQTIDVSAAFQLDAASNRFQASAAALNQLLAGLPPGELEFTANLISRDFAFTQVYSFAFLRPTLTISGRLVDGTGAPLSGPSIDDLSVAVVGFNSGIRRVVPVDALGGFVADGLIVDTYRFVVADLEQANVFTGVLGVFPGSTSARIDILYIPRQTGPLSLSGAATGGFFALGSIGEQDGDATVPDRFETPAVQAIDPGINGCPAIVDGETFFTVTAAARGQNQSCLVSYSAPPGTAEVMIEVVVSTEEFPDFTTIQSEFNDSWSYSLNIANAVGPASLSRSGLVNDSHVTTGSISRMECVSARTDAEGRILDDPPIAISGSLTAQNVGDGILPTRVAVKFTDTCGNLFVRKAEITTPNSSGEVIVTPIRVSATGNRGGRFLSLPRTAPDGQEIGVPLTIDYAPRDAEISEVRLALVRGGAVIAETENLLGAGIAAQNGTIRFDDLILPRFAGLAANGGRIGLSVRLIGTIDGEPAETERGDVNVEFQGGNNFTPLYLAEVDVPGAARRYGQVGPERGDDNWALASTIAWLQGVGFRFNDISAQHVAQTAAGRSILDHSGHSDGSQVDLRYQDPQGMFAQFGNTAENTALVNDAFAEFQAGTGQTAAQERLAAWILFNRDAIEDAATDARRIYVADGALGRALLQGTYTDGSEILALPAPPDAPAAPLGRWQNRPSVVHSIGNHVNHWHISLD